jgi:hypothetical protein
VQGDIYIHKTDLDYTYAQQGFKNVKSGNYHFAEPLSDFLLNNIFNNRAWTNMSNGYGGYNGGVSVFYNFKILQ